MLDDDDAIGVEPKEDKNGSVEDVLVFWWDVDVEELNGSLKFNLSEKRCLLIRIFFLPGTERIKSKNGCGRSRGGWGGRRSSRSKAIKCRIIITGSRLSFLWWC